jgi:hypothetical protein
MDWDSTGCGLNIYCDVSIYLQVSDSGNFPRLKIASILLQCSVIPADDVGALNNQLLEISAV